MDFGSVDRLARALGPDAALHAVGGWVRDRWLGRSGGDLDLASALLPGEAMARARAAGFRVIPTGLQHGTITVLVGEAPVELTTFRGDGDYRDGRRPESVRLGVALEEDLARRDFTINALALPVAALEDPDWRKRLVDPFEGRADLEAGLIRAVGDPLRRFAEDGLRPLRACRFASQLGFSVEADTLAAIPPRLEVAAKVSIERVFVELTKLLCGRDPARGLRLLESTGLLDLWMPELRPLVGCPQNRHHRFDVWEHTLHALTFDPPLPPDQAWGLLLHDLGKPATRTLGADGEAHFVGHEKLSEDLADQVLQRLKAPNRLRDRVAALIRLHGEHPEPSWSDAAFRRLLKRLLDAGVEPEAWELFRLRDHLGKGWSDGHPDGRSGTQWKEDTLRFWAEICGRLESVRFPGMTVKELALDGTALMAQAGRPGGPWLGQLQKHLLERVLEDPGLNTEEGLRQAAEAWLRVHR
ncbi:MAG: HD domain-containing protein [Acidobacteria bacterium]|nr:HD domain-containing protein [Acidobacteriota bacterium]